jgi:methionyl-tRNA formyltransferase
MSIVFFGTPRFAVPSLEALLEVGEDVAAVVTRVDRRRGRGGAPKPSPVKETALKRGIRVLQPVSMKDERFISELRALRPDFIVVVAYGKILSKEVLDVPSIAPVNLHASLLPGYRGSSPIAWAVINGEEETGITTMLITEGLDEGDVLLREKFKIMEDDTAETLSLRLAEAGGPLLVRTLRGIRDGSVRPVPQAGEATYVPMLKKGDGKIDWSRTAREIYNFVRGMYPWPGAFCFIEGRRTKLLRVRPLEGEGKPGMVLEVANDAFTVGAGGGLIEVFELQSEGKRPMRAGQWLRGRKITEGTFIA